jgi:ribokinase
VLGDLIVDVAARLDGPILVGSDTPAAVTIRQGGSAANSARWLARLGAHATFIGAVGRDAWGRVLTSALAAEGVTVHAPRVAGRTARLVALVAPDGERSFLTDRGAAARLAASAIRAAWWRDVALLHLPAYSLLLEPLASASARAARLARQHGAAISVDLASAGPLAMMGRRDVLARLRTLRPDVLFGNLAEVAVMTAGHDARALVDVAPLVVVKLGGAGCRVLRRGAAGSRARGAIDLIVPTRPVDAPDTTGAGDAFNAGFLAAWVTGSAADRQDVRLLRRAARAGHRAAARQLMERRAELRL